VGRLVLVVELRDPEGAAALLRHGPPFPIRRGDLDRCWAFLSEEQVVLLLEGPGIRAEDPNWRDLERWENGAKWRSISGPARVAESAGSWEQAPDMEGFFFGPDPGPGDSEGGL
jgi:hypothetical protein